MLKGKELGKNSNKKIQEPGETSNKKIQEPRETSTPKILSSNTSKATLLFLIVMVNDPSWHCWMHHMASKHHCPIPNLPMSFKRQHHSDIGITKFLQEIRRRKNSSDLQPGNSDPPTPPTPPAPSFDACLACLGHLFGSPHLLIFIDGFKLYRSTTCIPFQSVDLNLLGHEFDK